MPPPKAANRSGGSASSISANKSNKTKKLIAKYVSVEYAKYLVLDPAALPIVTVLILLAELLINVFVINRVPYTEIDWRAYMQECEGFLNGTTDYAQLKGDTGPLVYPAGFVYIYSALYYLTAHGSNVRVAQYIFAGIYLLQMWLVLRLYAKSRKVPPYVLAISAFTSYRVHSIYVLRLFNDPVAVLFVYAALNLFLDRRWTWGSVCFSLGVGVKMNILLFAPALLLFYITNLGYMRTVLQLAVCGGLQLLLGAPFLLSHPLAYLRGSFDLGRIFEHKWTVNYRFLPPALFEHRFFHLSLLALHVLLLLAFARPVYTFFTSYTRLRALQQQLMPQLQQRNKQLKRERETAKLKSKTKPSKTTAPAAAAANDEQLTPDQQNFLKSFEQTLQRSTGLKGPISPAAPAQEAIATNNTSEHDPVSIHFDQCAQLALLPFFLCNFIGLLCARSLHYQFYIWYYHSLPYLTWCTAYSLGVRFLLLGLIELCWNTYPSTVYSSALLHACHALLLVGVARVLYKQTRQGETMRRMRPKAKDN